RILRLRCRNPRRHQFSQGGERWSKTPFVEWRLIRRTRMRRASTRAKRFTFAPSPALTSSTRTRTSMDIPSTTITVTKKTRSRNTGGVACNAASFCQSPILSRSRGGQDAKRFRRASAATFKSRTYRGGRAIRRAWTCRAAANVGIYRQRAALSHAAADDCRGNYDSRDLVRAQSRRARRGGAPSRRSRRPTAAAAYQHGGLGVAFGFGGNRAARGNLAAAVRLCMASCACHHRGHVHAPYAAWESRGDEPSGALVS